MLNPNHILSLLFRRISSAVLTETADLFELKAVCSEPVTAIEMQLKAVIEDQIYKDPVQIIVEIDDIPFTYDSEAKDKDNNRFFAYWNSDSFSPLLANGESVNITLIISKVLHGGSQIHVYDLPTFWTHLAQLTNSHQLYLIL